MAMNAMQVISIVVTVEVNHVPSLDSRRWLELPGMRNMLFSQQVILYQWTKGHFLKKIQFI